MPTAPEVPRNIPEESAKEALQNLLSAVQLPLEAMETFNKIVGVFAKTRNERLALVNEMQQEKGVPKQNQDLLKIEAILAT